MLAGVRGRVGGATIIGCNLGRRPLWSVCRGLTTHGGKGEFKSKYGTTNPVQSFTYRRIRSADVLSYQAVPSSEQRLAVNY